MDVNTKLTATDGAILLSPMYVIQIFEDNDVLFILIASLLYAIALITFDSVKIRRARINELELLFVTDNVGTPL